MRQKETKQKKIAARTVRFAVIGSVVLGIATLLAGLLIYHNTLLQVSISRGESTVVRAAAAVQNSADVIGLSEDVMGVYSSLTQEQRSRTGTEEYRALFRQLEAVTSPDGAGSILPAFYAACRPHPVNICKRFVQTKIETRYNAW